jgi:hypothetical protein
MSLIWEKRGGPMPGEPFSLCHALVYIGKYKGTTVFRIYRDSPVTLPRFKYMLKMPSGKCCWAATVEELIERAERIVQAVKTRKDIPEALAEATCR